MSGDGRRSRRFISRSAVVLRPLRPAERFSWSPSTRVSRLSSGSKRRFTVRIGEPVVEGLLGAERDPDAVALPDPATGREAVQPGPLVEHANQRPQQQVEERHGPLGRPCAVALLDEDQGALHREVVLEVDEGLVAARRHEGHEAPDRSGTPATGLASDGRPNMVGVYRMPGGWNTAVRASRRSLQTRVPSTSKRRLDLEARPAVEGEVPLAVGLEAGRKAVLVHAPHEGFDGRRAEAPSLQ